MGNSTVRINVIQPSARLLLTIGLTALCSLSAMAQTPTSKPAARPSVNASVVVPQLQDSYNLLATADNDYHGHRDAAMKEIAAACQLLGRYFTPPSNPQKQKLSDLQVRSVQMVLLDIGRAVPAGDNNVAFVARLNAAILELAQALQPQQDAPSGGGGRRGNGPAATHGPLIVDNPINTNMVQVGALEDIYLTLSVANHDYKGHRAKAMNALARAVKALGGNIHGDGRGKEEQLVSDQQLHYAQHLLEQVSHSFSTNDPQALREDLATAYNQLTMALSVK